MKNEILGNSPWRIDSREETELAQAADNNWNSKVKYVEFYQNYVPDYHKKGLEMIKKQISQFKGEIDKEREEYYIIDMFYSLHRFGCMYDEYFLMGFEYLNADGRSTFITDKNRWDYYAKLNGKKNDSLFRDKAETYKLFGSYYHRDFLSISTESDFDLFCKFRKKHPRFICKPSRGSGGSGIYIEDDSGEDYKSVFNRIMLSAPVVIEEIIHQHPSLSALHPGSVNTVRIPTVRYADGTVKVFHPFLRIGVGTSVVDNAASGGIFAPIEPDSGIIFQKGITEFGKYYFRHPESNIVLPGFQIPDWDGAVSLVKELADVIPSCRYVGWDCALTEKGWLMVEGNLYGQFVDQFATKQGIRKELDDIVKDLNDSV